MPIKKGYTVVKRNATNSELQAAIEAAIPQAVVQLRMWVQDGYSGQVLWTNRVDVKVSPQSVLADYQYDALFEAATEKAVDVLVDDFMYNLNPSATTAARLEKKNYMKKHVNERN